MSMYSDYERGALDEVSYHNMSVEENARERATIDDFEALYYEDIEAEEE